MDRTQHKIKVHQLWKNGLISRDVFRLHLIYSNTRFFGMKEVDKIKEMSKRGWECWPNEKMMEMFGVLEVFDESPIQICRV